MKQSSCRTSSTKIFLLGLFLGGTYGMLFADTSGKELRAKLKKSKKPFVELLKAGMNMDMNFFTWLKKFIEEKL